MFKTHKSLIWTLAALLLITAPVFAQDVTVAIDVDAEMEVEDGNLTFSRVVSDGPGWLVIHADNNGAPGEVAGYTAVEDGENMDVVVELDLDLATETMYAMLHQDLGTEGTFEFPGVDAPVEIDGETFIAFDVTGLVQETATATPEATATITATAEVTGTAGVTPTVSTDEPEQLPETGGSSTPWTPIILVGLGLVLLVVGSLVALRRTADINIRD